VRVARVSDSDEDEGERRALSGRGLGSNLGGEDPAVVLRRNLRRRQQQQQQDPAVSGPNSSSSSSSNSSASASSVLGWADSRRHSGNHSSAANYTFTQRWVTLPSRHHTLYLYHRMVFDFLMLIAWTVGFLERASAVARQTCPPLWTAERCASSVRDAYPLPLTSSVVIFIVVALSYSLVLLKSRNVLLQPTWYSRLEKRKAYAYVCIFLFLHVYGLLIWLVYVTSLSLIWMVPFGVLSLLHDAYLLRIFMTFRYHPERSGQELETMLQVARSGVPSSSTSASAQANLARPA
jgi:hypothetical protein